MSCIIKLTEHLVVLRCLTSNQVITTFSSETFREYFKQHNNYAWNWLTNVINVHVDLYTQVFKSWTEPIKAKEE